MPSFSLADPGAPVEVWNPSLARWVANFEVAEVTDGGYQIRRRSDGAILPVPFGVAEVRPTGASPWEP